MSAPGRARPALVSDVPLSFWGGVDPATARVIDRHHPLAGESLAGRALALPGSRGSCSGSGVLLELLLRDRAPSALIFSGPEEILTLGTIVAEALFDVSVPVFRVDAATFRALLGGAGVRPDGDRLLVSDTPGGVERVGARAALPDVDAGGAVALSAEDRAALDGARGEAVRAAVRVLVRAAALQGADALLDVTRAHVDGCLYTGPASLEVPRRLLALGARVAVPTTLNALSVDLRRWRALGVDPAFGEPAAAVADAYLEMGATPGYTCAPYLSDAPPALGEQIGWAESNAVVHANSVLGARTQKYPDFLDACIAIAGRAPAAGCHLDAGRRPTLRIEVEPVDGADDAFWPLVGYRVGELAGDEVPLVTGLESSAPSADDLKGFCAAFATTSASALCHVRGVTPEAAPGALDAAPARAAPRVTRDALLDAWRALDTAEGERVDLVCLGNPHFSASECASLAGLVAGRTRAGGVRVVVTTSREVEARARAAHDLARLEAFGVELVTDTCWCMLAEPVIPARARTLLTSSAKYAHYAPGLVGRGVRLAGLADCVEAACTGALPAGPPAWLADPGAT